MLSKYARVHRTSPSRRGFLKGAGAAAGMLVIGTHIRFGARLGWAATPDDPPMPNAFIRVASDNSVTVIIKHLDMGQGVTTGLTTIVADEIDADWAQMRAEFAPADAALYNNLYFGPVQGTGGSTSIANSWDQLRKAAAAARAMLAAAAADAWKVPVAEITVAKGMLAHGTSARRASFGAFAAQAATLPVPQRVVLKAAKDWAYIGTHVPRIDSELKTTGKAVYAMDVKRPGMLTAVIKRPPRFGGTAKSIAAAAAKSVKGVIEVLQVPQGVAVIAKDTWSAIQGREALQVEWDDSKAEMRSTETIFADYRRLAGTSGLSAARRGDAEAALRSAAKVVEAEFTFPYLAHAPMEPLNGVIELKGEGTAEIWAGAQLQTIEQATAAAVLGLPPERVKLNTLWAGGSFGRRAVPNADYFAEMAAVAKAASVKAPIHLVWTREDDIKGGRYRPMALHRIRAGLDVAGNLAFWEQRIVCQSFFVGTMMEPIAIKNGIDEAAVEGAADTPYAIPNLSVEWHHVRSPVPTLWWRSVGHSHTAHAIEVTIDALAHAGSKDPVEFRLALLKGHPRHAAVLRLAAEKSGWSEKLPAGRGRGIAVHESFRSYIAMAAEVSVAPDGVLTIDRVVAAVDCGVAVNPDIVRAQVESSVGYALGAALRNKITLTNGVVDQANFGDYEPLRISEMPKVEVHIVSSREAPTGIGEPAVPPVAPAVTNAIFAATGKRLLSLPWDLSALRRT